MSSQCKYTHQNWVKSTRSQITWIYVRSRRTSTLDSIGNKQKRERTQSKQCCSAHHRNNNTLCDRHDERVRLLLLQVSHARTTEYGQWRAQHKRTLLNIHTTATNTDRDRNGDGDRKKARGNRTSWHGTAVLTLRQRDIHSSVINLETCDRCMRNVPKYWLANNSTI